MTRKLSLDDTGDQYIQFRGRQTSVTADEFGILFSCELQGDRVVHKPLPVVDPDENDPPANAVARPVAERLTERNPMICWGVACEHPTEDGEVCGKVLESPKAVNSHKSVHSTAESDQSGAEESGDTDTADSDNTGDSD